MTNKVTIKDIASKAGVGISTVSRVLNGLAVVKDDTRERVLAVCREMNYVPNGAARMLVKKSGQENTIALLLPVIAHQFFFEVISALQNNLKQQNMHSMIFNTDHGQESVIQYLLELRVRAVIVLANPQLSTVERELLKLYRVPLLYIDRHDRDCNFITYSNIEGGRLAAEYLNSKNCKNVRLVGISDRNDQQTERFNGFREYISEHGIQMQTQEILVPDQQDSLDLSASLMKDSEIDGYCYFTDAMAMAGKQAASDLGVSIPIIGYDDIFPARFMKLSTIRQSAEVLGSRAGEMIQLLTSNADADDEHPLLQETIHPQLIIRD